jgi:hypothetical protein
MKSFLNKVGQGFKESIKEIKVAFTEDGRAAGSGGSRVQSNLALALADDQLANLSTALAKSSRSAAVP